MDGMTAPGFVLFAPHLAASATQTTPTLPHEDVVDPKSSIQSEGIIAKISRSEIRSHTPIETP
jgi:hypothetical protein